MELEVTDLGALTGAEAVRPSALTPIVQALERKGLVVRQRAQALDSMLAELDEADLQCLTEACAILERIASGPASEQRPARREPSTST
jgi:DNA-binding MarR family transcriptional regulator